MAKRWTFYPAHPNLSALAESLKVADALTVLFQTALRLHEFANVPPMYGQKIAAGLLIPRLKALGYDKAIAVNGNGIPATRGHNPVCRCQFVTAKPHATVLVFRQRRDFRDGHAEPDGVEDLLVV